MKIASRQWAKNVTYYVSDLKSKKIGCADWGYTDRADKALPLTDWQAARFNADCRAVGAVARFRDVLPLITEAGQ